MIELSTEKIKLVASRIDNSLRDAVKWRSKGITNKKKYTHDVVHDEES